MICVDLRFIRVICVLLAFDMLVFFLSNCFFATFLNLFFMKRTYERPLFHFIFATCFPLLILFIGTGCQSETIDDTSTKLVGTWYQTSKLKDETPTTKDSTRLLMQINATNICVLCDSSAAAIKAKTVVKRSGWNYTGGLFNLAVDLPASWTPQVTANELSLERVDFNQAGAITKTTIRFVRTANIDFK